MFEEACREGWEGVIAKRADSLYTAKRSRDWLKFKCEQGQELVIGGYTAPARLAHRPRRAARRRLRRAATALRGQGRDGLQPRDAARPGRKLEPLRRDDSPFADAPRFRDATWVEPELVAQIGFAEWTRAGRLRHPRFLGLRFDKPAPKVVRENATSAHVMPTRLSNESSNGCLAGFA